MLKTSLNKSKRTESAYANKRITLLCDKVATYIRTAHQNIVKTVNTEIVKTYWLIGKDIVEEEQNGKERAGYGKEILQQLSLRLKKEFGAGFSMSTLTHARRFYLEYSENQKSYALRTKSVIPEFKSNLGWTHYRSLMQISKKEAREFYTIEASKNCWSSRELDRQISSLLYERLALSKNKKGLLDLTLKGQEINTPEDVIKDPYIMEFLGFPESHKIIESELEESLITHLQKFLLELGKGFAFVARQQRLTLDNEHFYVDLVFYHTVLKRYILIDLKSTKLTHADLGQMQLYRNYYDMEKLSKGDNPTIGLILCTQKSKKMVRYFLGTENTQIFASQYKFALPTEAELEAELKKEIKAISSQYTDIYKDNS